MVVKSASSPRRGRPKALPSSSPAVGSTPPSPAPICSSSENPADKVRADVDFHEDVSLTAEEREACAAANLEAAPPVVRTEGQRLLLAVPGTLELIGDSIGATRQAVALWRSGQRTPGPQWRRAMHERFGIAGETWARTPLPDGYTAPAPRRFSDPIDDDGPEPSALDDVRRLLRDLRGQLDQPNLLPKERVTLSDAFARALAQRERLEQSRAMLEDRTIREHAGWKRLRTIILTALLDYPDAARAVGAALQRELGDDGGDP